MTVSATPYKESYAGNGVTTVFSVPFYFLADTDLVVNDVNDTTGVITPLALTTNYTVSGAGTPTGGAVTLLVATASGHHLTIERSLVEDQPTHFVDGDPLPAAGLEQALDRIVMLYQQAKTALDRAAKFVVGSTSTTDLPEPVEGTVLGWVSGKLKNLSAATAQLGADLLSTVVGKGAALVAYLAPFTSAVAMTLQTVIGDFPVSVGWFGADFTGTTDATSAIQAAVNALGGNPGLVRCKAGTLKINGTVTCPVGTSFEFDGTVLDISGNTGTEVFSYNAGYAGSSIFQAPPTRFKGCRVNGLNTGLNSTTYLWKIFRMPYFFAEDVTLFYSLAAHIVGESIICRWNRVNCYYMPAGDLFLQEIGTGSFGPNGCSFTNGYIEQSYVAGCTAFHLTSGDMAVKNTYLEAINTFSNLEGAASIAFEGCSIGMRPSVLWQATPGLMTGCHMQGSGSCRMINTGISIGLYTSWSGYLFFVDATATTTNPLTNIQFDNGSIVNQYNTGAATELTLFKLRAPIVGSFSGNTISNYASACRMNIFDTSNASYTCTVAMAINGNSIWGASYGTGNPDSVNWEYNGSTSGPGYVTSAITGNSFTRVTNFTKQSNSVVSNNTFVNQQALIYTDPSTATLRSIVSDNVFNTPPAFTNPGQIYNNMGLELGNRQTVRTSTGSIGAGAFANVSVTWPRTWPGTNYTCSAVVLDPTYGATSLLVDHLIAVTTTGATFAVKNASGGALTGTLHATAIYDNA